jgi:prephenate dehydratase
MSTIAIQGQAGSYHETAAVNYFGDSCMPDYQKTFADVFAAVDSGSADFGITAVENSLVGSITPVYDLLKSTGSVAIMGEIYLGIHHSLLALPDTKLEDIKSVYSHPVALAQCTNFLKEELPNAQTFVADDTASSAVFVKDSADKSIASIASSTNGPKNGLSVLKEGIENNPENYTRFLVLTKRDAKYVEQRSNANKTSLFIEKLSSHEDDLTPGTLYSALGCFAMEGIGITKVESRPIVGKAWRYDFYIDCAAGATTTTYLKAADNLKQLGAEWRELGTYNAGDTIL